MSPNGAGKSTILKTIFGLNKISSGQALWHVAKISPVPHEIAELGIAFLPQGRKVLKYLTVDENLDIGGYTVKNQKEAKRRKAEIYDIFPALKAKNSKRSFYEN